MQVAMAGLHGSLAVTCMMSESHCVAAGYGKLRGCRCQDRDVLYRKLGGGRPTCHFFNSFFINKLYNDQRKYCYSARPGTTPQACPLPNQCVYGQVAGALSKQCAVGGECQ